MENKVTHLGIIMDGNRRWARMHKAVTVLKGHEVGSQKLIDVCKWCKSRDIRYLTVYAFSTENWKRTEEEVDGLFEIMRKFFRKELDNCIRNGLQIQVVGDRKRLPPDIQQLIANAEAATGNCTGITVNIALNYGGRDELLRAVRQAAEDVKDSKLSTAEIDEIVFGRYLDTNGCPDMDLVIRTGGDHRLSNFFPWQTTYAELYFTDTLWPDFSEGELDTVLENYRNKVKINKGK